MTAADCDALYLSPHLDDVALSCGGQVFQRVRRGERVVVATLAAGDEPPEVVSGLAATLFRAWGLHPGAVMVTRRREDEEACRILGAAPIHLDLAEAIHRLHPATGEPLYPTLGRLFGRPDPVEAPLADRLAARLRELPAAARVFAPLGIGGHVDHRLTRTAAERTFGDRLAYYEDYPYAERPWARLRAARGRRGLAPEVLPLEEAALAARIGAIGAYGSQIESLFGGVARVEARVRRFVARAGGERVWRPV